MRLMKQDCGREMGSVCAFAYECLTMTKDHNDKAKKDAPVRYWLLSFCFLSAPGLFCYV